MPLTDLVSMRMLVSIRDSSSIGAASKTLGVSQQAVSARMRALESQLGLVLLTRSARGTALTTNGLLIAGWATEVLGASSSLESSIATLRGVSGQSLSIASSLTIAEYLLPRWLAAFREEQRIELRPTTIALSAENSESVIAGVRAGVHSLGFIETPQVPADLASSTVASDELVVIVGAGHAWAQRRRSISADELAATPLIVRERGSGTRQALEQALLQLPSPRRIVQPVAELPTTSSILCTIEAGAVPTVVSILAARDGITAGRFVRVKISDLRIIRPLTAVWLRSNVELPAAARALLRLAGA